MIDSIYLFVVAFGSYEVGYHKAIDGLNAHHRVKTKRNPREPKISTGLSRNEGRQKATSSSLWLATATLACLKTQYTQEAKDLGFNRGSNLRKSELCYISG